MLSVVICTLMIAFGCSGAVEARARNLPESGGKQVVLGIESWRYADSNSFGILSGVTRGTRSDTRKVVRSIEYAMKGYGRGIKLDIMKLIRIKYEVYSEGPRKGKLYRVYEPTVTSESKMAYYLGLFRMTVSQKSSVLEYGIRQNGIGVVVLRDAYTFKLPRQFPFGYNSLTDLLRQAFKIDSGCMERTFTIVPNKNYATIEIDA